jgi:hypothetical protein
MMNHMRPIHYERRLMVWFNLICEICTVFGKSCIKSLGENQGEVSIALGIGKCKARIGSLLCSFAQVLNFRRDVVRPHPILGSFHPEGRASQGPVEDKGVTRSKITTTRSGLTYSITISS